MKIHNFYTRCERIFKLIASDLNKSVPDSYDWYRRLLSQMATNIEGIRPAVISENTQQGLTELLAFRHIIKSVYGYELLPHFCFYPEVQAGMLHLAGIFSFKKW